MRKLALAILLALTQAVGAQSLVPPQMGGTGIKNNPAATLTRSGSHALTITTTGTTNVTFPVSGTLLYSGGDAGTPSALVGTNITGTAAGLTAGTASAVAVGGITGLGTGVATALAVNVGSAGAFVTFNGALGSPSSAGTIPAFTLGGTIAGGGNQINNVVIGASTPLAGSFTTLTAGTVGGTLGSLALKGTTSGTATMTVDATVSKVTLDKPFDIGANALTAGAISGTTGDFDTALRTTHAQGTNRNIQVITTGLQTTVIGFNDSGVAYQGVPDNSGYIGNLNDYPLAVTQAGTVTATFTSAGVTIPGTLGVTGAITGGGYSGGAISGTTGSFSSSSLIVTGASTQVLLGEGLTYGLLGNNSGNAYLLFYGSTHATLANKGELLSNGFTFTNNAPVTITGTLGVTGATTLSSTLKLTNLASDATHTDATVCQDTTSKILYYGSGTLGICLGTSSERHKTDIARLDAGLPEILALRPVSYRLKRDQKLLYGFTAEQGNEALPDLVGRDAEGRVNTFDYLGVLPVLVRAVQQQQAQINELRRTLQ